MKYKALLEGLEAKEIKVYECLENKDFRIDSGFYTKAPLINPQLNYRKIGDCIISSQYGISISMNEDGIGYPIYRMNEIHNMLCDLGVSKCAEITLEELDTFKLHNKDVLFNRTNSFEWVGRTGVYYQNDNTNRVFASYLVRFIPNLKYLLPEYLATYLNTKYGIWDIKRRARQSINQTNVNPEEVKEIEIPILPMDFQKQIADNLQLANEKRIVAHNQYIEAEAYLLECLGMTDFAANHDAYNVKTLKESFLKTGRLDAEYYLPRYEKLTKMISNYHNGFKELKDIVDFYRGNFIPDTNYAEKGIPYLRGGDISSNRVDGANIVYINGEYPYNNETICNCGDIVFAMIGSVGTAALITDEFIGAYISNNLGLLRPKTNLLRPEVLHIYLTSPIGKMFFEQRDMVTAQPKISFIDMEDMPVPIIRHKVQDEIAQHVQRSFALRKEAMQLLENAKLTVEQAIENEGRVIY